MDVEDRTKHGPKRRTGCDTTEGSRRSDAVMAAQEELVEDVHTLKQIVCVKG